MVLDLKDELIHYDIQYLSAFLNQLTLINDCEKNIIPSKLRNDKVHLTVRIT